MRQVEDNSSGLVEVDVPGDLKAILNNRLIEACDQFAADGGTKADWADSILGAAIGDIEPYQKVEYFDELLPRAVNALLGGKQRKGHNIYVEATCQPSFSFAMKVTPGALLEIADKRVVAMEWMTNAHEQQHFELMLSRNDERRAAADESDKLCKATHNFLGPILASRPGATLREFLDADGAISKP